MNLVEQLRRNTYLTQMTQMSIFWQKLKNFITSDALY
jgi:hypothetical protein